MKPVRPICVRPRPQLPEASRARIYHQTISYRLLQHPLRYKLTELWGISNFDHFCHIRVVFGHFYGLKLFFSIVWWFRIAQYSKPLVIAFYSILYDKNWRIYHFGPIWAIWPVFGHFMAILRHEAGLAKLCPPSAAAPLGLPSQNLSSNYYL